MALEVLNRLHKHSLHASLTWVGDGPLMQQAIARSEHLGLRAWVDFTGWVPPHFVGRQLSQADLFFLPSDNETFCVAAAEALAHGLPVVLSPHLARAAYFVTPSTGVFAAQHTVDGFTEAVLTALRRFSDADPHLISSSVSGRLSYKAVGLAMDGAYTLAAAQHR